MQTDSKEMPISEADGQAVDALVSAQPAWTGIRTAADALGLAPRTILHCGPPAKLLLREHPGLPLSRARCGLSARRVLEADATPMVELGIVDRAGIDGGWEPGFTDRPRPPSPPPVQPSMAGSEVNRRTEFDPDHRFATLQVVSAPAEA